MAALNNTSHFPRTFNIARVDNAIVYNMLTYTIKQKSNAVQREIDRTDNPLDTLYKMYEFKVDRLQMIGVAKNAYLCCIYSSVGCLKCVQFHN